MCGCRVMITTPAVHQTPTPTKRNSDIDRIHIVSGNMVNAGASELPGTIETLGMHQAREIETISLRLEVDMTSAEDVIERGVGKV